MNGEWLLVNDIITYYCYTVELKNCGPLMLIRPEIQKKSEQLLKLLDSKVGNLMSESRIDLGDALVRIKRDNLLAFFNILKLDNQLQFNFLLDVTAVDYFDSRSERFEVVYHLMSLSQQYRLRVLVSVAEEDPQVESLVPLWSSANFLEREVFDMFGIKFKNHPDLRRILMYDEFVGHPLRKDYPVQGKQPRIKLRAPEVRNTALDLIREPLIKINPKKRGDPAESRVR